MLLPDVNVLVYAHRPESHDHDSYRAWLLEAAGGDEVVGLCDPVLTGFVRVVTHSRIYQEPTPPGIALEFCSALLGHPNVERLSPGPRCWSIFGELLGRTRGRGNHVPDAWLAAMAIERGATWISDDADFARYAPLRWRRPLS